MCMPCRSFVVAGWANAWLAGATGVDDVLDAVRAWPPGGPALVGHHVYAADEHALGILDSHEALPLPQALIRLRMAGADAFALALPEPGDPLGLAGPRGFTEDAIDIGEAVLAVGVDVGLVPHVIGAGVQWAASLAHAPAPVSAAESDERLVRAMAAAVDTLSSRAGESGPLAWPADSGPADLDRRRLDAGQHLPPNLPRRCERLMSRAQVCQAVLEQVRADPGLFAVAQELSAAARRAAVAVAGVSRGSVRQARP